MLGKIKHIYFVGIGGIGMSGIAELLLNQGYRISGSDMKASSVTKRLEKLGAKVYVGHEATHVGEVDVMVISSAVKPDNPEVIAARERQIPVIPRAEMLAELMHMKYGIAIAGAHGKTTTTSMIATIVAAGGLDPTVVIGGRLNSLGSNARLGAGQFLVAEADESDGSFLKLSPTIAVVTNIDAEHLDHYGSLENIKRSFLQFMNKVPFYGAVVLCLDQKNIQELIPQIERRYITYGLTGHADLTALDIKFDQFHTEFKVIRRGKPLGSISLSSPGLHNVYNALASVGVGLDLGISFQVMQEALSKFTGADRRFQLIGQVDDIMVVDDYGHHPTEIKATLKAAKSGWGRRTVVIFQPHRYTRTQTLLEEFYTAFYDADILVVTEIYAAGEKPIPGVSAWQIAEGIRQHGHRQVIYVPNMEDVVPSVLPLLQSGDMVITLGAGNVTELAPAIVDKLTAKSLLLSSPNVVIGDMVLKPDSR